MATAPTCSPAASGWGSATASPRQSNGLPLVFSRFTGEGRVTDLEALVAGEVMPIDREDLGRDFRQRMPLGYQVADFGP